MADGADFANFTASMRGMSLSHIWRGHGSAIFLEFGVLMPVSRRKGAAGNPIGEFSLMVEWSWRLEGAQVIVCGSWSDEALWPESFATLYGTTVLDVALFGQIPEICVHLSNQSRVVSFATREGDPAWTLFDNRQPVRRWLAIAGGKLRLEQGERPGRLHA